MIRCGHEVGSPTVSQLPEAVLTTWDRRLLAAAPVRPLFIAAAVPALLISGHLATSALVGDPLLGSDPGAAIPLSDGVWVNLVVSLLIGYTLAANYYGSLKGAEDLA